MRLSTDADRDEEVAIATIAAAAAAGVTVFDTARAYGRGAEELGHNERLLARALRRCAAEARARIVTKGGMTRTGGGWIPDGRAGAILRDCEASLGALGGLAIDLYLLHAPDPRTPWRTSVRALARLLDERLVRHVGVANVSRPQLDEALQIVDVTAVQVALSPFDVGALRGGLVEHCAHNGIAVMAHSPLGGPRRAGGLARREVLTEVARRVAATPAEVALAWLLDLSPAVIPIPGARRPQTARSAARAARLGLPAGEREALARAFGTSRLAGVRRSRARDDAEVIVVMGIPGAGKSRLAHAYTARGYLRLNRDERRGSLRELAGTLEEALSSGIRHVVLDNTYLTRALRSHVIEVAGRHHVAARCIWLDTPLAQAQVNLVERLLDRSGVLPSPEALREMARREPGVLTPTSQMRTLRELEPPSMDEGWVAIERIPFARASASDGAQVGVLVAAAALQQPGWKDALRLDRRDVPHLVFDWNPDGIADAVAAGAAAVSALVSGPVESALCPHGAGPPACWCRPPLRGLALAFARRHNVDLARSILVGTAPAHRTLATTLGADYVAM
jgi:aryl-alcohol dehydrogenase-like predicted oxidoreductase/predicted kinase